MRTQLSVRVHSILGNYLLRVLLFPCPLPSLHPLLQQWWLRGNSSFFLSTLSPQWRGPQLGGFPLSESAAHSGSVNRLYKLWALETFVFIKGCWSFCFLSILCIKIWSEHVVWKFHHETTAWRRESLWFRTVIILVLQQTVLFVLWLLKMALHTCDLHFMIVSFEGCFRGEIIRNFTGKLLSYKGYKVSLFVDFCPTVLVFVNQYFSQWL